jgi:eukaryotic-like serine/threonine-protein kinase
MPSDETQGQSFASRFAVDASMPLPQFDTLGAVAYGASDKEAPTEPRYALIHHHDVPHRSDVYAKLADKKIQCYVNAVGQGILEIDQGEQKVKRLVTVLEAPMGPSLASAEGRARINSSFIRGSLLRSMVIVLAELGGREVVHRAIRPHNIFFKHAEGNDVVLGECFSAPPGSGQPEAFEPLERSDTMPLARGEANIAADMFAVGATIVSALLGQVAGDDQNPSLLFETRCDLGSMRALLGKTVPPDTLKILLQGLLADEEESRWGINHIAQFMDGASPRTVTGSNSKILSKAAGFSGQSYTDRRALAKAFAANAPRAIEFLQDNQFGAWCTIHLSTEVFTEKVEELLNTDMKGGGKVAEMTLARICAFLDPEGPIRFGDIVMAPDGIDTAIAAAFASGDRQTLDLMMEFYTSGLVGDIFKIMGDKCCAEAEVGRMHVKAIEMARNNKRTMGMNRILYELNPSLPCQSDNYKAEWARSPRAVIKILDTILGKTKSGANLLDNDFCAFCSAKSRDLEGILSGLTSADLPSGTGATRFIESFGMIQSKSKSGPLPHLCTFLCAGVRKSIEDLRFPPRKKMLLNKLSELAATGDLGKVGLLKLGNHIKKDKQEYAKARQNFAQLDAYRKKLAAPLEADDPRVVLKGYNGASTVAMLVFVGSIFFAATGL